MSGPSPSYWHGLGAAASCLHVAPFAAFLLLVAFLPLLPATASWWASNRHKLWVAAAAALAGGALYVGPTGHWAGALHAAAEYLAFLSLLGALYIISGGIHISGAFAGFPYVNTAILALGAVLANLLGTTGASMLLLRPLLRANRHRRHKTHIVVFFIFLVGNCGGLLTPLGDPPLFLGALRGVPFAWTLGLWKPWALMNLGLLFVFHLVDERFFIREDLDTRRDMVEETARAQRPLALQGWANVPLLAGVVLCVILSGGPAGDAAEAWFGPRARAWAPLAFQILLLPALAACSWRLTARRIHEENQFSFHPIQEVAAVFLGVFGSMLPALAVLEAKAGALGLEGAGHYFWATGLLSAALDNAPTYLTFATLAAAQAGASGEELGLLAASRPDLLAAISCGAVFMGALTYLGNGPNLMIKAVAEHSRVRMPSFGGYMLWAAAVLGPLLAVCGWLFF